jgi:hypothetical protein
MPDELFGDRLLLIDDEIAFGQIVKKVAQSDGFEVVVTDDTQHSLMRLGCGIRR